MEVPSLLQGTLWRKKVLRLYVFTLAEDCPVVYTIDDTKPDGSYPAIIGFLPANKARTLLKLEPEQRKQLIIKSYAEAMKTEEALHPIHYEEFNWAGEQYSGGCYTSMMPPGLLTTFRSVLRDPIGRLFFAGTETATEWSGYINGGIQAGERAAREVLHAQGKLPKDQVWQKEPPNDLIVSQPFVDTFAEKYMPSVPAFLTAASLLAVPGLALSCFLLVKRDLLRFNYFDL
uniref:Amine oxidase n=1 Tax=Ixodes scapularis TaxID=6945 RepID=A0A4D5RGA2_IXOSC